MGIFSALAVAQCTLAMLTPRPAVRGGAAQMSATVATEPIFAQALTNTELKMRALTLAASLDRGQSYNPTSSGAYAERMQITTDTLRELIASSPPLPTSLEPMDGEWELIFTNVAHGIFRSSPFFLAIQESYANAGVPEK